MHKKVPLFDNHIQKTGKSSIVTERVKGTKTH